MEWNKTYEGESEEGAYSLVETSDGGYALAGTTNVHTPEDCLLIKTDADGNREWQKKYGGDYADKAHALVETPDGGFVLAGRIEERVNPCEKDTDFWLVKTDENGTMEWNQTYGGEQNECAYALVATADGGFAIAGATPSFGAGGADFWLAKTDEYCVIPEFPSGMIGPLLATATLVAMIYKKKLTNHRI